jgi:hypothetical protein
MTSGFVSTEETESDNLSPSSLMGNGLGISPWGVAIHGGVKDGNSTFGKKDSILAMAEDGTP